MPTQAYLHGGVELLWIPTTMDVSVDSPYQVFITPPGVALELRTELLAARAVVLAVLLDLVPHQAEIVFLEWVLCIVILWAAQLVYVAEWE